MEKNKLSLILYVADQLSAAKDSDAKAELVEELSDNLYQRYQDLVASGVREDEAVRQVKEQLGDTAELIGYLNELEADEPLPETEKDLLAGDMNEMMKNVEDIVKYALQKAKGALGDVKDTMEKSGVLKLHWNEDSSTEEPEEVEGEPVAEEQNENDVDCWKFTVGGDGKGVYGVEVDTHRKKGRFYTGSPKPAYEFGYDERKGFYGRQGEGSRHYDPNAEIDPAGPVPAGALKAIEIRLGGGDVKLSVSGEPDSDVIVGGDIEDLDVRASDGVLSISECGTAVGMFKFGRGLTCADVELTLPCRFWERISVLTGSGDIVLDGEDARIGELVLRTSSGDVESHVGFAALADCRSVSGDVEWSGGASEVTVNTTSGDVELRGSMERLMLRTVSGDAAIEGSFSEVRLESVSGDVEFSSDVVPAELDVVSRSGDCELEIPDNEGFHLEVRTGSGEFDSDFFEPAGSGAYTHLEGGERYFTITSGSGDVELNRR